MDREPLAGILSLLSLLPQYLMKAILGWAAADAVDIIVISKIISLLRRQGHSWKIAVNGVLPALVKDQRPGPAEGYVSCKTFQETLHELILGRQGQLVAELFDE